MFHSNWEAGSLSCQWELSTETAPWVWTHSFTHNLENPPIVASPGGNAIVINSLFTVLSHLCLIKSVLHTEPSNFYLWTCLYNVVMHKIRLSEWTSDGIANNFQLVQGHILSVTWFLDLTSEIWSFRLPNQNLICVFAVASILYLIQINHWNTIAHRSSYLGSITVFQFILKQQKIWTPIMSYIIL